MPIRPVDLIDRPLSTVGSEAKEEAKKLTAMKFPKTTLAKVKSQIAKNVRWAVFQEVAPVFLTVLAPTMFFTIGFKAVEAQAISPTATAVEAAIATFLLVLAIACFSATTLVAIIGVLMSMDIEYRRTRLNDNYGYGWLFFPTKIPSAARFSVDEAKTMGLINFEVHSGRVDPVITAFDEEGNMREIAHWDDSKDKIVS